MTRRRRRPRPHDDRGTSLVLALVFITVGSLVLMAVLGLADASLRYTRLLSIDAGDKVAAEAAASVAINNLRKSPFAGSGTCLGPGNTLQLPNFYQRSDGSQDSARVICTLDSATAPALVTLDTTATSGLLQPVGIWVTNAQVTCSTCSLKVTGDVHSNSNIVLQPKVGLIPSNLTSSTTIRANRSCSASNLFQPSPTCDTGTVLPDPGYPVPPVADLPTRAVPACAPTMVFDPGRYTDWFSLSQRTGGGCAGANAVLHFRPGVYYFDFGPSTAMFAWLVTAGTIIGGTLRPGVTLGPTMPVPNSCVSPIPTAPTGWTAPGPNDGVTFVFSGGSQMVVSGSARVELCGRYVGTSPSLAITAEPTTGSLATTCTDTNFPCAAVSTGPWPAPAPTAFVVQGTTYLPSRELVLNLTNASNQGLRGGAVVHRAAVATTRTTSAAVIEPTVRRTVASLDVYLCPGASTCTGGGAVELRIKVAVTDPTGVTIAGMRQVTVLSWLPQG